MSSIEAARARTVRLQAEINSAMIDATHLYDMLCGLIRQQKEERDSARADLAEALAALRELYEAHDIGERDLEPYKREAIIDDATQRARTILSKHAKPEGGAT